MEKHCEKRNKERESKQRRINKRINISAKGRIDISFDAGNHDESSCRDQAASG